MDEIVKSEADFAELALIVDKIKAEFRKIIIGQEQVIELMIAALIANGHVLIEGVPGVAKTTLAKIMAKVVSSGFSRIQFTPDLMPSDIIGTSVYNLKTSEFSFKKGPVFSDIVLIDEINRAPAKTQAALFEVMQERQLSFDGVTYPMSNIFAVFATQNPVEHEGTYRLPEAELDRFIFKIEVGYPSGEEEIAMLMELHNRIDTNDLSMIQPVLSPEELTRFRKQVSEIYIQEETAKYIAQITAATRKSRDIFLGASPRASLAVLLAAKANAAMKGRNFVTPDDIREMLYPVLNHRILVTAEKEMEGVKVEDILKSIITSIEIPR